MSSIRQSAAKVFVQPRLHDFQSCLDLAQERQMGLELIELSDPSLDELSARLLVSEYRRVLEPVRGIPLVMHGPYIDLYVNSPDPYIRQASRRRVVDSVNHASELGIGRIVFHTNHLPCTTKQDYTVAWREASVDFWGELCSAWYGEILLENMWDSGPELLTSVLDAVGDSRLAACLDLGHANVFSDVDLRSWITALGSRLRYVHVSDNHGTADDALVPGEGSIDWFSVSAALSECAAKPDVMLGIGLGGTEAMANADDYLQAKGLYPYQGAGT
jgi:sugar phosphate isomerase/epimerase